jgi:hypothetical protein
LGGKKDNMNIRKATQKDASTIIDFQQKMAWETEQMILVPEIIYKGVTAVFHNTTRGQYWVAEEGGNVIASLLLTYEWSDWRMYLCIKEEAETKGVAGLRLYVETNNSGAQKTYEALGMNSGHYKMYEWFKE